MMDATDCRGPMRCRRPGGKGANGFGAGGTGAAMGLLETARKRLRERQKRADRLNLGVTPRRRTASKRFTADAGALGFGDSYMTCS